MVRPKISNTQSNDDPLKKKPLEDLLKKREVKRASVADMLKGGAKKALAPKDFSGRYGYQSSGAAETQGGQVDIDTGEAKTGTQNTPSESKAPITAGFASKPQYKLPGPDGQLGTDDDEINPEYAPSRSKSILTGMSLAGQLAQGKSQSIYYRLGAALAGGVAGILNPELAGQQEYEKDLAKHYAETEATYKLQKIEAEIKGKEASRILTEERTNALRAKEQAKTREERIKAGRQAAAVLVNQYRSVPEQDRADVIQKARQELAEIYMESAGMSMDEARGTVTSMAENDVMNGLANWAVDQKSPVREINGTYYRVSVNGSLLEVTDQTGQTFQNDLSITRLRNAQVNFANAQLKAAVNNLSASEKGELFDKAFNLALNNGYVTYSNKAKGIITPNSSYIVKQMYESLLVEKAKENNPELRSIMHSFTMGGREMSSGNVVQAIRAVEAGPKPAGTDTKTVSPEDPEYKAGKLKSVIEVSSIRPDDSPDETIAKTWSAIPEPIRNTYSPYLEVNMTSSNAEADFTLNLETLSGKLDVVEAKIKNAGKKVPPELLQEKLAIKSAMGILGRAQTNMFSRLETEGGSLRDKTNSLRLRQMRINSGVQVETNMAEKEALENELLAVYSPFKHNQYSWSPTTVMKRNTRNQVSGTALVWATTLDAVPEIKDMFTPAQLTQMEVDAHYRPLPDRPSLVVIKQKNGTIVIQDSPYFEELAKR